MAAKPKIKRKAIKPPRKRTKSRMVLEAAESIFAQKGFHETTISDIARQAKVSEATIYEYFTSKEELLFAIPAETIHQYQEKNREILPYIEGAVNKLRFLIIRHLGLYADNPDYANVVMLILKGNRKFIDAEAYKIVQSSARHTIQVLKEGVESGEFRSDIDPYLVRSIIWGTVEHLVTRKSLLGKPEDLQPLADEIIRTIFKGIVAPENEPGINVNVKIQHDKDTVL